MAKGKIRIEFEYDLTQADLKEITEHLEKLPSVKITGTWTYPIKSSFPTK